MREYGQIQSTYWTHPDTQCLSLEAKIIGAYLLTCQHTNGIGCFRMPIGYISIDIGIGVKTVSKGFQELNKNGFLSYGKDSDYVLIPSFLRWNPIPNPNAAKARAKEFESIPSSVSIFPNLINALQEHGKYWSNQFGGRLETLSERYRKGIGGVLEDVPDNKTIPNQDQDQDQDQDHTLSGKPNGVGVIASELLAHLNAAAGRNFRNTPTNLNLIKARLSEGYSADDVKSVIDRKTEEWLHDSERSQYLRPGTLFNASKFNDYAGQVGSPLPLNGKRSKQQQIEENNQRAADAFVYGDDPDNSIPGDYEEIHENQH